jgi:DNA repair protein RAD51
MSAEEEQFEDSTMGGPGAPTPVSALEVGFTTLIAQHRLTRPQGVNGLTARDIKLIVEGGFNTVESIAYTYVGR